MASAGQMATRFEIARHLGYGAAGTLPGGRAEPAERPAFPQLANALYYASMQKTLAEPTARRSTAPPRRRMEHAAARLA